MSCHMKVLVPVCTLSLEDPFRSPRMQCFLAVQWGRPQSWSHHGQAPVRGCCRQTPLGFPHVSSLFS